MSDFIYPLRMEYVPQGLVVEFTGLTSGTVISQGTNTGWSVGQYSDGWTKHTDTLWTPVVMSKRIFLHNKVKDFRD